MAWQSGQSLLAAMGVASAVYEDSVPSDDEIIQRVEDQRRMELTTVDVSSTATTEREKRDGLRRRLWSGARRA